MEFIYWITLIILQLIWNYNNLYSFIDKNNNLIKYHKYKYYYSWLISILPIIGAIYNLIWTITLFNKKYIYKYQ